MGCRQWPLAKVIDIHPGKDGHVRVVMISSIIKSTYRRPASKVTLLLEGTDSSFPGGSIVRPKS